VNGDPCHNTTGFRVDSGIVRAETSTIAADSEAIHDVALEGFGGIVLVAGLRRLLE
jgi:hypothetical protein